MPPIVIDTRTAEDSRDVVHRAVQALAEGKLVAFPTETVYGIAASALDAQAVERLLAAKGRRAAHPITLAIRGADEVLDYVPDLSPLGRRLARRCWPGPVTLVAEDHHKDSLLTQLPLGVRAAVVPNGTVGLRVPAHPLILDVLRMLTGPLTLTSANRTDHPEAVTAEEVVAEMGDDIDLVLDAGKSRFGQPSSVIRITDSSYQILREGVVTQQHLKRLSSMMLLIVCTGNTCRSPMAEVVCRQLIAARLDCKLGDIEDHGVMVASAGIAAMTGGRASPQAVEVMATAALDLSGHGTQPVTEQLVRHADFIYTMTRGHREAIVAQWPDAATRTDVLCTDGGDVSDPIGGPKEAYERCAQQIRSELESRIASLDLDQS